MPHQNTVFRQLSKWLPVAEIDRLVAENRADKGVRRLSTRELLLTLLFAQLSGARSLRDIEAILESQDTLRYHSGLPAVRRSTLADATARRPAALFTGVLAKLMPLVDGRMRRDVGDCVRLIDSATVRLRSLNAGWAEFSAHLCGAKAHIVYDPDADCRLYLGVTPAKVKDITAAKDLPIEPLATYVFDLGYYEFAWWKKLDDADCRIVTRFKRNTQLVEVRKTLRVPANASGIISDRIGFLPERMAKNRRNPMNVAVREVTVKIETGKVLHIFSNDLDAPASEIAALYKRRWDIELFFRWIKQTMKLRHIFGTTENAVRIQIAVALIAFVLIKLAHGAQNAIESLTRFGRLIGTNVLHRIPLDQLGAKPDPNARGPTQNTAQGWLLAA